MDYYLSQYSELHLLLAKYGKTQEDFAHDIGVTVSTVNRWIKGRKAPGSRLTRQKIEEVLNEYEAERIAKEQRTAPQT